MQLFSYHTHTTFSDGKNSVHEMIEKAIELGWQEMGISDHLIIHKNISNSPSWYKWQKEPDFFYSDFSTYYEKFARHIDEIRLLSEQYPLKVRIGAEVDFFVYPGWLDEFVKLRDKLNLDYCISGNHFLFLDDEGDNIIDFKDAKNLSEKDQKNMIKRHFSALCQASSSNLFDFMAHIDFIRKIPLCGDNDFWDEKNKLIETIASCNGAIEISTKGLRKSNNFYPADNLLKKAVDNNIKFVISDDAHRTSELGYEFDHAEKTLQELNCSNRWKYIEK